ncbi:MAG: flavin reductase family protein [Oscillospiraceae bacterium]
MHEIDISSLSFNPFEKIGKQWFLITAGDKKKGFNTMTASWGFMGVMWGKDCIQAVVRPNRYTFSFLQKYKTFTVSFFPEEYRKALSYCGTHSGRDVDKIAETGLTPVFDDDAVYFEEAENVFVCRRVYMQAMNSEALDKDLREKFVSADPMHVQIIGEIEKIYEKDK